MGLFSGAIVSVVVITGVIFSSPVILSLVGLSAIGPVAGGLFATTQGAAIATGSWYAAAQVIAMATASPLP